MWGPVSNHAVLRVLVVAAAWVGCYTTEAFPHRTYSSSLSTDMDGQQNMGTTNPTTTTTVEDINVWSPSSYVRPSWVDCHPKQREQFQLLSWNILAPCYAPPSRLPWSLPQNLEWTFRKQQIVNKLLLEDPQRPLPDIICLQQVQVDLWKTELEPALEKAAAAKFEVGKSRFLSTSYMEYLQMQSQHLNPKKSDGYYEGVLQKVNKKKPIATAILVRKEFAKILKRESRSRALIVVLELNRTGKRLVLANVHLQAGAQEYHQMQRFYQIQSLMKRIDKFVHQYTTDTELPGVAITGDFNMTPDNPLYHLLRHGQLPPVLFDENNLEVTHGSSNYEETLTQENFELAMKIPHLPLCDAYQECCPQEGPQQSSYTSGDVIDYLWTCSKGALTVRQTWQSHPDAGLDATGMFLKGQRYPNAETPSDHLPIGAILEVS